MSIYKNIAETVNLQQQIFNCSVDQVWEKHIHPRIREVHSLDNIKPYIKQLKLQEELKWQAAEKLTMQGFFVEHQGYVITLLETQKGTVLQVFKEGKIAYKHPQYNPSSNNIPIFLRRHLSIRRLPAVGTWKRIQPNKFESIINQKKSTGSMR